MSGAGGWPAPGTALRRDLDALYWGGNGPDWDRIDEADDPGPDGYFPPMLDHRGAPLAAFREEHTGRPPFFVQQWREYLARHGEGLDVRRAKGTITVWYERGYGYNRRLPAPLLGFSYWLPRPKLPTEGPKLTRDPPR